MTKLDTDYYYTANIESPEQEAKREQCRKEVDRIIRETPRQISMEMYARAVAFEAYATGWNLRAELAQKDVEAAIAAERSRVVAELNLLIASHNSRDPTEHWTSGLKEAIEIVAGVTADRERIQSLSIRDDRKKEVLDAIQRVLDVLEKAITTGVWDAQAAESAESAESAARFAARSAASSAAYKRYADELIRLLEVAGQNNGIAQD